jgi:hypothetical protein
MNEYDTLLFCGRIPRIMPKSDRANISVFVEPLRPKANLTRQPKPKAISYDFKMILTRKAPSISQVSRSFSVFSLARSRKSSINRVDWKI